MQGRARGIGLFIRSLDSRIRLSVEESPAFYMTLSLAMLIVLFFRNIITLLLGGLFFAAVALFVLFGAFLVWVKGAYGRPTLPQLFARKNRVEDALMIARRKFMKRKISEKEFNGFFVQKQRELIEIEATMAQMDDSKHLKDVNSEVSKVSAKKRHLLRSLLDEKKRLVNGLEIAENSYLKRKINAVAYQELVKTGHEKLIETEAGIKSLYREDSVSKVMDGLKKSIPHPKEKMVKLTRWKKAESKRLSEEVSNQAVKKTG